MNTMPAMETRVDINAANARTKPSRREKIRIDVRDQPSVSSRKGKWSLEPRNGERPFFILNDITKRVSKMGSASMRSGASTPHSVFSPYDVPMAKDPDTKPRKRLPESPIKIFRFLDKLY